MLVLPHEKSPVKQRRPGIERFGNMNSSSPRCTMQIEDEDTASQKSGSTKSSSSRSVHFGDVSISVIAPLLLPDDESDSHEELEPSSSPTTANTTTNTMESSSSKCKLDDYELKKLERRRQEKKLDDYLVMRESQRASKRKARVRSDDSDASSVGSRGSLKQTVLGGLFGKKL